MSKKNSDPKPTKSEETKNDESKKEETPKDEKNNDEKAKDIKEKDKKSKNEKSKDEKPKDETPTSSKKFRPIPFTIATVFTLYEIASFLLFLFLLCRKHMLNKQYQSNSEDTEVDKFLLTVHLIFHLMVIIFIVFLITFAYKDASNNSLSNIYFYTTIISVITLVFWAGYFGIFFVTNKINHYEIIYDELVEMLNTTSPSDFIFVYSKDKIKIHDCNPNPLTGLPQCTDSYAKCYSKKGIKIPLKSELLGERYNFLKDPPKYFYFKINQVMNFSDEFQKQYNRTIAKIKRCSHENLRVKFFPLINKTYVVMNPEKPPHVTPKMKLIAAYLGAGFDFDLYVKSVPFFNYEQKVRVDVDPNVNYTKIWTGKSCKSFGECDPKNIKPHPSDDEL